MFKITPAPDGHMRFFLGVLLPVLASVIATFSLVGALIYFSAKTSDSQAQSREVTLVTHNLNEQRDILRQQQANAVGWDDAMAAVTGTLDLSWISTYLGLDLYQTDGHDLMFLLDPRLHAVFAMQKGNAIDPVSYAKYEKLFAPFARRLRELDWQGALAAYSSGASQVLPSIGDLMVLDGQPALVSFMPIASDSARFTYRPGAEFIHITAQYLDQQFAKQLGDRLLLHNARFSTGDSLGAGEFSVPLTNRAGQVLTRFVWTPGTPGARIWADSLPAMIGAFSFIALIVLVLMYRLRRSTRQIEDGRAAAQHMAFHDGLTGLANRALFEDRLTGAIAAARRGTASIALLVIDLDRFKQVNDTLGHEAGDQLICEVAERLRPLLRETDTIARLGGDEFAIVQTDVNSISDVTLVASRIIETIAKPFEIASSQAFVGASIGIALSPVDAVNAVELVRKAGIALYEAKSAGRNQFKMFEDRMGDAVQRRRTIEDELRAALTDTDGLDVKFVPLMRSNGTELAGVIASAVWTHAKMGLVPPERFVPVAERCGLIEQLGEYVLRAACRFGSARPGLRVSVRAYVPQLRNPLFFTKVFAIFEETGMRPTDLELEICESMLSDGEPVAAAAMRKLRDAGINIAIADFGSGFQSLGLLQKFQVDRIRIDRAFIAQLSEYPDPAAIVRAVVDLAKAIGIEVSADGVDTAEQRDFLIGTGVMSFQGQFFTPEHQAAMLAKTATSAFLANPETPQPEEINLLQSPFLSADLTLR